MLAYRIFASVPTASPGTPGHADFTPTGQTSGRWDNADAYRICYLSLTPEGAVGEVFGDIPQWKPGMFQAPYLPGSRRELAIFEIPGSLSILDLDDAQTLVEQSLRPTQVVIRNPGFTQGFALRAFRQRTQSGARRWDGIRWWSFHRPYWPLVALWIAPGDRSPLNLLRVEPLDLDHAAVRDAAKALARELPPVTT